MTEPAQRPSIAIVTQRVDDADRRQAEADAHDLRKRRGRRRADAVLGIMRATADEGRDMHDLTSDDADCIWAVAALYHRAAGQPEQAGDIRPADSPKAAGAAISQRTLDPGVEAGAAAGDAP